MMGLKAADLAVAAGVGLATTGVCIATVQFLLAWINHRADLRLHRQMPVLGNVVERFLDWLSRIVLDPSKRLDHEPLYSFLVSAIFLVGIFWMVVGQDSPTFLGTLQPKVQVTLATCLILGAGTCIYGIFMGTFMDGWRHLVRIFRRFFRREKSASLPPLDIRRSYRVGASGIPTVVVGLSYYNVVLFETTPMSLTGTSVIFLLFVCAGLTFQWLRFLMENRRINRALPILIDQEIQRQMLAASLESDSRHGQTRPMPIVGPDAL